MNKYPLLHKIGNILLAAADRVTVIAKKTEAVPGKAPEILVLIIYAAAHLGMAFVHEPFFDEAEAWQIARCVSLRTLFLETTHYEGHPPLWHLILMPLAKSGAPYELSLTLVSLLFMGTAVFLILRYAPFPRIVRLLLPFTYFFFYQYGVISRVYCVMALLFVLLAMTYRRRNERPGRYVAVLMLLCATMAYGLVIAGGLAIVWLWEIWNEKSADSRIWWLALLLAAAILVIWMIMPRKDTYAIASAASEPIQNPFPVRLLYTLFVLPADAVLTDIYSEHITLSRAFLMPSAFVSGVLIGMMIWGVLLYYGRKKGTTLLLLLPYGLFAVFSALVYMSVHHIGIGLLFFCFWCWASVESGEGAECAEDPELKRERAGHMSVAGVARCAAILGGTLAMAVSLYWTGAACRLDIGKTYAPGRNEAAFIREHRLDRCRMMTGWMIMYDEEGNVRTTDINECNMAVNLAPYFEHNLFFNFNGGKDERNYITHIRLSEEETEKQYALWGKEEPPQVLWMSPDLSQVYGGSVKWQDYVQVYRAPAGQMWKAGTDYLESSIHVRRDLLEETGLLPLLEEE